MRAVQPHETTGSCVPRVGHVPGDNRRPPAAPSVCGGSIGRRVPPGTLTHHVHVQASQLPLDRPGLQPPHTCCPPPPYRLKVRTTRHSAHPAARARPSSLHCLQRWNLPQCDMAPPASTHNITPQHAAQHHHPTLNTGLRSTTVTPGNTSLENKAVKQHSTLLCAAPQLLPTWGRRSTSTMWLSVPPLTSLKPRRARESASALELASTWWGVCGGQQHTVWK